MVKATMDIRLKAVVFYQEKVKTAREISQLYSISERTLRRWVKAYREEGLEGLRPRPTIPRKIKHRLPKRLCERILKLKQEYPSWGARRIKHQFDLPVSWRAVHNVIKKNGLLVRIKAKPQPCKRFQRRHVDSLWQGDIFEFRIRGAGKVYVFGFLDDCSRYRVCSKAYLRKRAREAVHCLHWALKHGRKPEALYIDNGRQFKAEDFKAECKKLGIGLIFGRTRNPKGRGKIESYHKTLYRELISQKEFASLSHFRRELWKFDRKYNYWRKQEVLGWQTPARIYHDQRYFNKKASKAKSGQMLVQQIRS